MKFTIMGFGQELLVGLGFDIVDAAILQWFSDFMGTGVMKLVYGPNPDRGAFYWVKYQAIIDDLPSIKIKNREVLARRFKRLVDAEILEFINYQHEGTYTCYRKGPRYSELFTGLPESRGGSTLESTRVDRRVDTKNSPTRSSYQIKDSAKAPKRKYSTIPVGGFGGPNG